MKTSKLCLYTGGSFIEDETKMFVETARHLRSCMKTDMHFTSDLTVQCTLEFSYTFNLFLKLFGYTLCNHVLLT